MLLAVALVSAVATWFFIGKLPDTYKAESVISTGIIDYKGVSLQRDNPFIQQFQIESSFSGLIEKMKSRGHIKTLTERLLAHDLLVDGISEKPFRRPEYGDSDLSQTELNNIALKLKANLTDSSLNSKPKPPKPDPRLAEAFGYDYQSIIKKLEVNRIGETDYLSVGFESENPELSFFAINTFIIEFLKQHEDDLSSDEKATLEFNQNKLRERKRDLDSIIIELNNYKTQNGLVDVSTQSETVISQQRELELRLQETNQSIPSLQRNIQFLEKQIFEYNKITANQAYNQVVFNEEYINLKAQISKLQSQLVERRVAGQKNNKGFEQQLEVLKEKWSRIMEKSLAATPKSERQTIDDKLKDLVKRHLDLKLELDLAQEAQKSYSKKIVVLKDRAYNLLVNDNYLYNLETEKDRLDREYRKIRTEYEEAKLHADGTESPLMITEPVELPTEPESKNRAVFAAFAGVAGGSLASIFLFLLAFVDTSISTPGQFQQITRIPLVGYVNKVAAKKVDLQALFSNVQKDNELEYFKENIRKIRTAIETSGAKSFLFVSPKEQEGKSFLITLLAYALSLNDKKILIIDTNFKNNTLSDHQGKSFFEITTITPKQGLAFSSNKKRLAWPAGSNRNDPNLKNIDIVANKGGSQSPSEVMAGKDFHKIMVSYSTKYDFIFMEAAAMNKFSDARELLPYVEKLAVVFSAESPVGNVDKSTLGYLNTMNGKMFGGILNNIDLKNI